MITSRSPKRPRTCLAILVPEARDGLLHLGMLGGDNRVMPFGEDLQQLGAPLRGALDLEPDCVERSSSHIR